VVPPLLFGRLVGNLPDHVGETYVVAGNLRALRPDLS
jgi:hypothetical protein